MRRYCKKCDTANHERAKVCSKCDEPIVIPSAPKPTINTIIVKQSKETEQTGIFTSIKHKINKNITGIENRTDLNDDEKVEHIIKIFAVSCSGIALQPIPFADTFILTPLQGYMGTRIANIRGIKISDQDGVTVMKEVVGLMGMGFFAQQLAIAIFKMIPVLGSLLSVPVVVSLTYGIGKIMDAYFVAQSKGDSLSKSELQSIFKEAKAKAKANDGFKDLDKSNSVY